MKQKNSIMLTEVKLMKYMTKLVTVQELGANVTFPNLVRNLTNSFLTLEKCWATQKIVCKVLSNEQEITDISKIHAHIYQFYQHLYKENTIEDSISDFLNGWTVPSLTMKQSLSCEGNLTEKKI